MKVMRIAGRDLRGILREKTILVALAVQFVIAATSSFLAVGLLALYDPEHIQIGTSADVGYVGDGGFDAYLRAEPGIRLVRLDADVAVERFHAGTLDAVVEERRGGAAGTSTGGTDGGGGTGGNDGGDGADGVRRISVLAAQDEIQTTILVTRLRGLLEAYEHDLREERQGRLETPVLDLETPAEEELPYTFLFATLLPLLVLTPVFLSGALAGDSFVEEVQRRTLALLRSAPVTTTDILAGKLVAPVLLAPAQVLLWVALLRLNGAVVAGLPLLLALTAALAAMVAAIGILVASWVQREGQTQAAYALAALLLGAASLFLPRDPLNVVALIATGGVDGATWATLAWIGAATVAAVVVAVRVAARRMASDRL